VKKKKTLKIITVHYTLLTLDKDEQTNWRSGWRATELRTYTTCYSGSCIGQQTDRQTHMCRCGNPSAPISGSWRSCSHALKLLPFA